MGCAMEDNKQALGGKARAESLDPERRSEIASKAAKARWQNGVDEAAGSIPRATHFGQLRIGDLSLPCAVLEDKTRIITEASVAKTLGRGYGGKTYRLQQKQADKRGMPSLPLFLSGATLDPHVPNSLRIALSHPKLYRARGGVRRGIEATLLPEICEVWLRARDANALQESQKPIAKSAEVLMRALAHVAIVALVDEATGYQKDRDRGELHKILEAYIAKELLPWAKRFPDEFYAQLFRLKGWEYAPPSVKRPTIVGKLTAQLVYDKLPPGVLKELREKNPVVYEGGGRRHKHHQLLTEDIGNPHLERHLASVITLMRVSPNWATFKRLFDRAYNPKPPQLSFPGLGQDEDKDLEQALEGTTA